MYGDTTIQLVRSRWQFFRSTTGIKSGPDGFEETRSIMTFLTNFGVTRIGCTFKLVLEESAGIRKTWVTKIFVPRKDYSKQICLIRCRRQELRKIKEDVEQIYFSWGYYYQFNKNHENTTPQFSHFWLSSLVLFSTNLVPTSKQYLILNILHKRSCFKSIFIWFLPLNENLNENKTFLFQIKISEIL